jgi:hypothetical protein
MPLELAPALTVLFLVGLTAAAMELRAAFEPPSCPECPHCRLVLLRKREREEEERARLAKRMWGIDERDDGGRRGPPAT